MALLAFAGHAGAATRAGGTGTDPWISSELPDYTAGSTVNLLGGSWQPGEAVHLTVNDDLGQTWSWSDDVTADADGDVSDSLTLPNLFVSNYNVTATGASGSVATSTFTDAQSTTTTITSSLNPSNQGDSVTFTGTVTYQVAGNGHNIGDPVTVGSLRLGTGPNCQGGFVQFTGASGAPDSNGRLSVTTSSLTAAGSPYTVRACYTGTGGNNGTGSSEANLSQVVNGATASVSGTVYQDSNGNGSLDAGEPGIAGISVSLSGSASATATTNASGVYTFSSLAAGNYGVDYTVPTGYANTGTKPIASFPLSAGQNVTGKDFFARKQTSTSLARTGGTSPTSYGNSLTFTATVTSGAGNPNNEGTVQFKDGANTITGCGAVSLTGNTASCTVSKLSVAGSTHSITAVYSGTTTGNGFAGSTSGSVSQDITAKALTVNGITASNKIYDGLLGATINTSSAALSGVVAGDTVTLKTGSATGAFLTKAVATGKTVQISGLTISGTDAGNYSLTQPTTTADITAKNLTISGAVANNKTYDGNTNATVNFGGAGLVGVASGDTVTIDSSGYAASFGSKNVGTAKAVTVSGVGLGGGDAGNYSVSQPTGLTANITARDLTVSASGVNKVYDGTAAATVNLSSDKLSGDTVTLSYTGASFADKNVGTSKAVSVSGISISGADAGNYHLTNATTSTTANVTAASLTVTAHGVNKVYDGTTGATATLSSDKLSGDVVTLSYTGASFANKNVGTSKAVSVSGISISGADAGNYSLSNTTASSTADITARSLTVAAHGVGRPYDGTTVATVNLTTDAVATDDVTATYTSATFASKNVGTGIAVSVTGISILGSDAGNYSLTNTTASTTADITAKGLTVTAGGVNKVYDGTTDATVSLSSDRAAGDILTLGYTSASFGDKSVGTGKAVSVSGISISGADAGNYHLLNTSASTTADITARGLTVSAHGQNKVYDGTAGATVTLSSDKVGGDAVTLSSTSASFADKNVGTAKAVSVSGISISGADAGNYALGNTTASTTADITAKALTVTAHGLNKVYDGTTAATVTLTTDALSADTVSADYTSAAFTNKNVGTGKAVGITGISISGGDAGNYSLANTTASAAADITVRNLTVTAGGVNRTYDGTTTASASLSSNKVTGDTLTLGYTGASFADRNVGTAKLVSVTGISISGTDAGNYNLLNTSASTTADISTRAITVTAVTDSKIYDHTTSSVGVPTVGPGTIATGDVSNFSQTFATPTAGSGKTLIPAGSVLDGNGGNNYTVTFVNNTTGVIMQKSLTVTGITAANKPWDGNTAATLNTSAATLNGVYSPDVVSLSVSGAAGSFSSSAVGIWTVSITGLTISGADSANYSLFLPATTVAKIGAWDANGRGFYAPVGLANSVFTPAPGSTPSTFTSGNTWNTVKGGQTVPMKFNVYAGTVEKAGSDTFANLATAFQYTKMSSCTLSADSDPVDYTTTAAGSTALRYDTTAMQWIYNWKTPNVTSTTCYRTFVTFADGSTLLAFFQITK